MAHRKLDGPADVEEYERYLAEGWPARDAIAVHIADELVQHARERPRVLELCCGPGKLAEVLLKRVPISKYIGIDIAHASVAYAKQRTVKFETITSWYTADLNNTAWLTLIHGDFDAVISMQSVHDLGGETEVRRIYSIVLDLLTDNGIFINADLLADEADPPNANPGRFSVAAHQQMLHEAGFDEVACTLVKDGFGCLLAKV